MKKEIILICGSRKFSNRTRVVNWAFDNLDPETQILIHGDCYDSPDIYWTEAEFGRKDLDNLVVGKFPANWKAGKQAGINRNKAMVQICDRVVAFWDGKSKGTKFTIDYANKLGKEVEVVYP